MPILVYVIQPEHTFLCQDYGEEDILEIYTELNNLIKEGAFMRFKLIKGQTMLINTVNIGAIRYISEKDVEESKKQNERERREQAQSNIIRPNMTFPRGRGRSQ